MSVVIQRVQRVSARLIDAYEDGLLEPSEFRPRIKSAKDRLAKLQAETRQEADREAQIRELQLMIGRLQDFAARVRDGLQQADWTARRDIVRALVKRVEIGNEGVRVVRLRQMVLASVPRSAAELSPPCLRAAVIQFFLQEMR